MVTGLVEFEEYPQHQLVVKTNVSGQDVLHYKYNQVLVWGGSWISEDEKAACSNPISHVLFVFRFQYTLTQGVLCYGL